MGQPAWAAGDQASWNDFSEVYLPAADSGALAIRIAAAVPLSTRSRLQQLRPGRHSGGRLSWGWLKEFADGGLGSRTAWFWEPYSDDPGGSSGLCTVNLTWMEEEVGAALRDSGVGVMVHAIGDRTVDQVAEVLARAARGVPGAPRLRVEHVQHISGPRAAQRLAEAGATAVINPLHLLSDRPMLQGRLGRARAGPGRAYAWGELQRQERF